MACSRHEAEPPRAAAPPKASAAEACRVPLTTAYSATTQQSEDSQRVVQSEDSPAIHRDGSVQGQLAAGSCTSQRKGGGLTPDIAATVGIPCGHSAAVPPATSNLQETKLAHAPRLLKPPTEPEPLRPTEVERRQRPSCLTGDVVCASSHLPFAARLQREAALQLSMFFEQILKLIWKLLPVRECSLCCEDVFALRFSSSKPCGHACCSSCWRRYLAANEAASLRCMKQARAFTMCCWGCDSRLDRQLVRRFGTALLRRCVDDLERREILIRQKPPSFSVVECPQMGCVGVGYDDRRQPSIMCFLCEHQWEAPRGFIGRLWAWALSWWPERIDGVSGWRPCPHCGAAILKDGGCPMMRCAMCHQIFRWGKLGNSLHGVIEDHAPPEPARRHAGVR